MLYFSLILSVEYNFSFLSLPNRLKIVFLIFLLQMPLALTKNFAFYHAVKRLMNTKSTLLMEEPGFFIDELALVAASALEETPTINQSIL